MARRYMGNSVPRKEDPTLLTGHSNFTDDIRLPGMLHMAFLRSPYAHARITSIDASAAREQPGVVDVFTSEDLADVLDGSAMETPSPTNPMGVKGIGESGAIAAQPAVINAVIDALSHEGITHIDMPASPMRVWQTLQEARGRDAGTRDADLSGRPSLSGETGQDIADEV